LRQEYPGCDLFADSDAKEGDSFVAQKTDDGDADGDRETYITPMLAPRCMISLPFYIFYILEQNFAYNPSLLGDIL
jgi:hypothetical protein